MSKAEQLQRDANYDTINRRIRSRRIELGLSQAELARLTGVTTQAVQQWEAVKEATVPRREHVDKLAGALEMTAKWLEFGPERGQSTASAEAEARQDKRSSEAGRQRRELSEPRPTSQYATAVKKARLMLSPIEILLLNHFRVLTTDQRQAIVNIVRDLSLLAKAP